MSNYQLPQEELKQAANREVFIGEQYAFQRGSSFTMQTLTPTLDKALEALESVQWISVEDRLPLAWEAGNWDGRRSDVVLAQDKDGKVYSAYIYSGFMDGSNFDDWYDDRDFDLSNVVSWMPLPDTDKISEAINELKKLKG